MIKHYLGHKFIKRKNEKEHCLICIECNLNVYYLYETFESKFIFVFHDEKYNECKLNISCDEIFIKKLLE